MASNSTAPSNALTGTYLQKTFGTKVDGLKLDTTLNRIKVGENEQGSG